MAVKLHVLKRDGNKCVICGNTEELTMGHYISRANGGHGCMNNLQVECYDCNRFNGSKDRTKGVVKGCKGCNEAEYVGWSHKKKKKNVLNKRRGFLFNCLMCNLYEAHEIKLDDLLKKKAWHYKWCTKQTKVKTGIIRELGSDEVANGN